MTSTDINLSKFFKDGIYFSCQRCGECCKGFNNGEVYLYHEDIVNLVEFLKKNTKNKETLTSFCKKYVKIINTSFYWKRKGASRGRTYSFKTLGFKFIGDDEHCSFLSDENLCKVHKARPFQCRAYPIGWNMLIKSTRNFRKYTRGCPGLQNSLKNEGHYHSPEEVIKWAKKEYEIEKNYFLRLKQNNFDIYEVYPYLPEKI